MPIGHQDDHQSGNGAAILEPIFDVIAELARRLGENRLVRRVIIAAVSVLMVLLLLLASCQTTASTTVTSSSVPTSEATVRPNYLGSFTLAQRVAESINQQNQVTSLFQSIPAIQRQGILLDEYVQYIRLLRRMTSGTITSLTRIVDSELETLLKDLRYAADLRHEGFYFQYGTSADPGQRLAFFQQIDEDGTPYLDRAPIIRVLSLQNYAALYFDAIDRSDRDALAVLIRSSADTQEARLEKADRILTFYHNEVATASSAFRIAMVMPDRITFVQSVYEDAAHTRLGTRRMTIYADGTAGFTIDDPIPDTLLAADLRFTSNGQTVFDFSRLQNGRFPIITSSHLGEIAGTALLHDDTTCTLQADGNRHMTAYYNGIIIEGIGRCDQHQFWRMQVTRVTFTGNGFLTSSGIGIGQPLDKLLLLHPFADETAGMISGRIEPYDLKLEFGIENKAIGKITLTISEN